MSRLKQRRLRFSWSQTGTSLLLDTTSTLDLSQFVQNPYGVTLTYSALDALPTGVTLTGPVLTSNLAPGTTQAVRFRVTDGTDNAEIVSTVNVETNSAPAWAGNTPGTLPGPYYLNTAYTVNLAQYASDPDGDALTFAKTGGSAPSGVTVSSAGVLTIPASLLAGNYTVNVTASDLINPAVLQQFSFTVSVASVGRKWNPGHYCQVYKKTQADRWALYDSTVSNNANLKGVMVGWKWNELEGATAGDYTAGIAAVQQELTKLRSFTRPQRLGIYLYEEGYNEGGGLGAIFPAYMANDSNLTYISGGHYYWKKWTAAGMDRLIALVAAYGNAFDGQDDIELFRPMVESSISGSTYNEADYRTQLIRLYTAIRTYWPRTLGWMPFNWEPWSSMSTAVSDAVSLSIAIGGPDTVTDTAHQHFPRADLVALGLLGGHNYVTSLEIPIVKGVEDSEMGYNTVGPPGGYTAAQIFAFCNSTMRASHIIWPRQQAPAATAAQAWATGIVPQMASALTYTSRRTNW